MANVDLQLDRNYVQAGQSIPATGGPYTVAANGKITVVDSDETAVRSDLGYLVVGGSGAPTVTPFARSMAGIDMMNTATKQPIFTVPAGSRAVITQIIVREATSDATACSFAFGFVADANDVVPTAAIGALTTDSGFPVGYAVLSAGGAGLGLSGDVFGTKPTVPSAGAGTCTVDVLGYFI